MRTLIIPLLVSSCIVFPSIVTSMPARSVDALVYASAQQAPKENPSHRTNPIGAATAAFQKRVEDYLKLRGALTKKIPEVRETGDPTKITTREKALGQAIAMARASARPGDIFGADMAPIFAQIIAKDWAARSAVDRKAIFKELPAGTKVIINQPYPTTLPLLTVPSNLLVNLPMLPDDLEYRIVDRHLLLRDRDANLVIDALYNVLPPVVKSTQVEK